MTFTTTVGASGVFGNKQYRFYSVANDSTSGTVVTGLGAVDIAIPSNQSSATGIYHTISGGDVRITTASGDDFTLLVIGSL